jgi:hypothetical protein
MDAIMEPSDKNMEAQIQRYYKPLLPEYKGKNDSTPTLQGS